MIHDEKIEHHKRIYTTLVALDRYWYKHPELRLAQIVSNAWRTLPEYRRDPEPEINDIYYLPDTRFLQGLKNLEDLENAQRERQKTSQS